MRNLLIGLVLLFASLSATAQTADSLQVLEYGIYTADKGACSRDQQGILRCQRTNVRHAVTTTEVPAEIGVEFGLSYKVLGSPSGARIPVKRVWVLPAPGFLKPGSTEPLRRLERVDNVVLGATNFASYGFDDPWELVPGPWVLEFWYGESKVGEQRFNVVKH